MAVSKFKMFRTLFSKDLREIRIELLVIALAAIFLIGWTYFKTEDAGRAIILAPTTFLLGLAVLLPVITSFRLLGREWNNNTIYMMMSLPVSGTMMLGSKLAVLFTEYLAGTLIVLLVGGAALISSFPDMWKEIASQSYLIQLVAATYGVSITGMLFIFCTSFMSQVSGKLFNKASGLISFIVFLGIFILAAKLMPDTRMVLNDSPLMISASVEWQQIKTLLLHGLYNLLSAVLVFTGAVLIWERRIEL